MQVQELQQVLEEMAVEEQELCLGRRELLAQLTQAAVEAVAAQ